MKVREPHTMATRPHTLKTHPYPHPSTVFVPTSYFVAPSLPGSGGFGMHASKKILKTAHSTSKITRYYLPSFIETPKGLATGHTFISLGVHSACTRKVNEAWARPKSWKTGSGISRSQPLVCIPFELRSPPEEPPTHRGTGRSAQPEVGTVPISGEVFPCGCVALRSCCKRWDIVRPTNDIFV